MAAEYEADLGALALRERVSGRPPPPRGTTGWTAASRTAWQRGRKREAGSGGRRTAAAIPSGASRDRRGEAPGREGGMRALRRAAAGGSRLRVRAADIRRGRASNRTNTPGKTRIFSRRHLNSPTDPPDNAFTTGIADSLRCGSELAGRDVDSSSITQVLVRIDQRRKAFSRSGDFAVAQRQQRRRIAENSRRTVPARSTIPWSAREVP